jgi:small subunit ribosomal protein S20
VKRSKSVLKRIRQNERCRIDNRANASKYKTMIKKLEAALDQNESDTARNLLPTVVAAIDKAVAKNALSKNSASRRKSSLTQRVNALG